MKYGMVFLTTTKDRLTLVIKYKGDSMADEGRSIEFSIAFQINRNNPTTDQSLNQMPKSFKDLVILYLKK